MEKIRRIKEEGVPANKEKIGTITHVKREIKFEKYDMLTLSKLFSSKNSYLDDVIIIYMRTWESLFLCIM